jgi:hypothetical protein
LTDSDLGSHAIPVIIEDVAVGTRGSAKRARRADPLANIDGVTPEMRTAALIFAQACEHVEAGRGMGPMPWAADRVSRGDGGLMAQERAITAAEWRRRGADAMGVRGTHTVVHVAVMGWSLTRYDAFMRWRRMGGRAVLLAALTVLAEEYGV